MNITDEQGVRWLLSKAYDVGNRYIVMNERREVFLFKNKPSKGMYDWYDGRNDFGCLPMCLCESFNQLVSRTLKWLFVLITDVHHGVVHF